MKSYSRRLTEAAARACEHATLPRCRCRCGGTLHGARRTQDPYHLPPNDPHHPEPATPTIPGIFPPPTQHEGD